MALQTQKISLKIAVIRAVVALSIGYVVVLSAYIYRSSLRETEGEEDRGAVEQMVIVIPGGGVRGTLPQPWTTARLDKGLELRTSWLEKQSKVLWESAPESDAEPTFVTLSLGTPHKPIPEIDGHSITEAGAAARYLIERGVSAKHILEENSSLDTIGNAFYLRITHLQFLLQKYEKLQVRVITNKFHFARTKSIFEHILSLPEDPYSLKNRMTIETVEVEDRGLTEEQSRARKEREKKSLAGWESNTKPKLRSLRDVHEFIFGKHMAYSAKRFEDENYMKPRTISKSEQDTY